MRTLTVADLVGILDQQYDPTWAEAWDRIGTVCGDLDAPAARVLFAVDPVAEVVEEAIEWRADLIVTHHPLLLHGVNAVSTRTPKGRLLHTLISHGIALHCCHTNADVARAGVSAAMATAVGVEQAVPLHPQPEPALDSWVTFVPHQNAGMVIDALHAAGAGAVGDYDRCHFASPGTGSFRPLEGADPAIGRIGAVEQVPETRLEVVAPRAARAGVLAALRAAHPYEEPAFVVTELAELPGARGVGRIGRLAAPISLAEFAARVAQALPATPSVLRVAGDTAASIESVAVCGGAGDFLLDDVRRRELDVYVTSDLRHHPVSELREWATLGQAPAIIDVPHWAAEWTWLPTAADTLGQAAQALGATVETRVSARVTDPWSMHLPMSGPRP